ncbi:MAG TPA: hypothetical protein VK206_11885, partial [Anaerolineales bacterium]|nr:hypothetical protein [Anaerolineales bacterium]
MRLALSAEDTQTLALRTEGWVVGLQMAALSLKGHANASTFIRDFSGSHRFVLDYLLEEVLKRQPTHIQTFLLETSILDKLNGSLCDALMSEEWKQSRASGQEVVEYLERSNLFIIPLDDHKQWYRYHQLFMDLLRSRLKQFSAERVVTLHSQASHWYERKGFTQDAISHAINAKDFQRAGELVEKMADYSISPDTNYATLKKWIDQIPENLISSQPWSCIAQAYISFMFRRMGNVEEWLQKAENIVLRIYEEGDTHRVEEIQNNISILRAYHAFFVGDLSNAINQAKPLLEKQHKMTTRLRGQVYQAMGECYLVTGELEKCIPLLREAMNLSIQIPNVFLFTRSAFRLGRALTVQGKLVEAKKVYQDNLRLLRESGLTDGSLLWRSEIGLGDSVRERGDLVTAERLLTEGLKHAQLQGQPFDLVFAYLYLSRLEHEKGNNQRALKLLEQADQLFQTHAIPANVRAQWEYYCVPIWIAIDDWKQIERWRDRRHLESGVPLDYSNEQLLMALSRVHIAQGKLTDALNLLAQLAQEVEAVGRNGRLIEIWNLFALAFHQKGNSEEALNFLRKSLMLAEPEGYRQIFLGEGEPMIKLLKQLRESDLTPRLQGYVNRLLESPITSEVIV